MCKGFDKITLPWNENSNTKVKSNPIVVIPSNFFTKIFSKYSLSFFFVIIYLVAIPATNGITTNRNIERNKVSNSTKGWFKKYEKA